MLKNNNNNLSEVQETTNETTQFGRRRHPDRSQTTHAICSAENVFIFGKDKIFKMHVTMKNGSTRKMDYLMALQNWRLLIITEQKS